MFPNLHPDDQLTELRERHARLRADYQRSQAFRRAAGFHRFRSRHRRP